MLARDRLRAHQLRADANRRLIGCQIVVLEEVTSTNDVVRDMASGDWPEGLVVFAEHQTKGRGRRGHSWESAAQKGLCFSALLRPQIALKDSAKLSVWAAQVIASTIQSTCLIKTTVKRPNDVYLGDRKVAGVLVEMQARPGVPHVAILGIGLNVNQSPTDFSAELREIATSLAIARRQRIDRRRLAVELLRNLDRSYIELFR